MDTYRELSPASKFWMGRGNELSVFYAESVLYAESWVHCRRLLPGTGTVAKNKREQTTQDIGDGRHHDVFCTQRWELVVSFFLD